MLYAAAPVAPGFNEAAGIHRRKPVKEWDDVANPEPASMRPPEFTGGNRVDFTNALLRSTLLQ